MSFINTVMEKEFVTFIIPSLNRPTLVRSVESIINQTDSNWKIIIVFDGFYELIKIPKKYKSKIKMLQTPHLGEAGFVRNIGLKEVDTSWVAFLDDDDAVESTYVAKLKEYIQSDPKLEVVYFSINWGNNITPLPNEDVGMHNGFISFAVKMDLINRHNILFGAGPTLEDRKFFVECKNHGKCLITYDPQYLVFIRSWWKGSGLEQLQIKELLKFL